MGFKPMRKPKYPRRHWSLVGFPEDGKSTFATQMVGPLLVLDADQRFAEVVHLAKDVYQLENPADNVLVHQIAQHLYATMPEEQIGTIVVDSLTRIIAPLVQRAVLDNAAGRNTNRAAAFVEKATAMKLLQDAVTAWGTDTLWIYHLQHGRDNKAKQAVTTSIPATELARLQRSLNARLKVARKGDRYGMTVEWCRFGQDGMTLWDETGRWHDMPEKLEEAMYPAGWQDTEKKARFAGPAEAIQWAVEQGAFPDEQAAKAAYEQVKAAHKPADAYEMFALWEADVLSRMAPAWEGDF